MQRQSVKLKNVIKEDVARIAKWLTNEKVSDSWFGRYTYDNPAHLGYEPEKMLHATEFEWNEVFDDPHHEPHRAIFSIYDSVTDSHIGEAQLSIDEPLGDAQISVLIGDPVNWHKGYGTASVQAILEHSFENLKLHRVWVDVPEFNKSAMSLFVQIGFTHEGTLRQSRPHHGARHNSIIMGMLFGEYESKFQ